MGSCGTAVKVEASSGSMKNIEAFSLYRASTGGAWPWVTCTQLFREDHMLPGRPPVPASSHIRVGGFWYGTVHFFGTRRTDVKSGGSSVHVQM